MLNVKKPELTHGDINMNTLTRIGAAAFGLALTASTAFAEDCTTLTVEDRFDLEEKAKTLWRFMTACLTS